MAEERRQPLQGLDNRADAWAPFQVVERSLPVHTVFLVHILVVPSLAVPFQGVPSLVGASQVVPFLVGASQAAPFLAVASLVGPCLAGASQVVPFQAGVAFQAAASQGEEEVEAVTFLSRPLSISKQVRSFHFSQQVKELST